MPVSEIGNIYPIMLEVIKLNPIGVIELGCGVGKYGVLCRETLDGVHGRVQRKDWKTRIVGVEGFQNYANPIWGAYDDVIIADFRKYYQGLVGWPLVMLIDSLEHVEETEARVILSSLVKTNKRVIVSVPVGVCPQDDAFGNEFERHRSTWREPHDFKEYDYKLLKFDRNSGLVLSIKGEG